jgi:hypothetical protein
LKLNATNYLPVYADDVDSFQGNINGVKRNLEAPLDSNKEVCLQANTENWNSSDETGCLISTLYLYFYLCLILKENSLIGRFGLLRRPSRVF